MENKLLKLRFSVLWCFLLYFATISYAQKPSPKFENVPFDQGLSKKSVLSILQDFKGFMWFGTVNGLYKYDGYKFVKYIHDPKNPHSLSDDNIYTLFEDRAENLWIGTNDGGLDRFDRETEQFIHYLPDSKNPFSISDKRVVSICEDKSGALWIGTQRGGLNKLLPADRHGVQTNSSPKFIHYKHNPDDTNSISYNDDRDLLIDHSGKLWIGTEHGGLNIFNPETNNFTHYRQGPDDGHHLIDDKVTSLYEDKSGLIWIGTWKGMNRFAPKTGLISRFGFDSSNDNSLNDACVWSICEDQSGNFWFAGDVDYGLYKYNPKSNETTHYQNDPDCPVLLSYACINSVYQDQSGLLWFGLWKGGLFKYNPLSEKFGYIKFKSKSNPKNLSDVMENWVNAIFEDHSGILWIGTEKGELKKIIPNSPIVANQKFKTTKLNSKNTFTLNNKSISTIKEDKFGKLWIGTLKNGMYIFNINTERFTHFNPDPKFFNVEIVQALHIDRLGIIWIGSGTGGIYLYNPVTRRFRNYRHKSGDPNSLISSSINTIYEDKEGEVWIGTDGGLDRLILRSGKNGNREITYINHYKPDIYGSTGLNNNDVNSICEDNSGNLWIGTGDGLNKLPSIGRQSETIHSGSENERSPIFTHYTEKDGLPGNLVKGILKDEKGNLWIGTNNGLSKFNPKTEIFINYDVNEGLQSNMFKRGAYFKRKNGMLCFGGINGFNTFYPDSIRANTSIPQIAITDFQLLNQSVKEKDSPLLKYAIDENKELQLTYKDYLISFEFSALDFTNPKKNKYAYMMKGLKDNWNYIGNRHFVTFSTLPPGDYVFKVKGTNSDGIWNVKGTSVKISVSPPPWKTWWAYSLYIIALAGIVLGYIRYKTKAQAKELAFKEKELVLSKQNEREQKKVYLAIEKEKETRREYTQKLLSVQEEQCKRISFELHDSVGQDLLVVKNLIHFGKKNKINVVKDNKYYESIYSSTSRAIDEVRDISRALHPVQLANLGLTQAIKSMINNFKESSQIEFTIQVDDIDGSLKIEDEIHIYRIMQESLNNIIKHSEANKVDISVTNNKCIIALSIKDNGKGFDSTTVSKQSKGIGLNSLSERVSLLNGELNIKSEINSGTEIIAKFPIGDKSS